MSGALAIQGVERLGDSSRKHGLGAIGKKSSCSFKEIYSKTNLDSATRVGSLRYNTRGGEVG